jgi:hypothetical protein
MGYAGSERRQQNSLAFDGFNFFFIRQKINQRHGKPLFFHRLHPGRPAW